MPQYGPTTTCDGCRKIIWADAQRFTRGGPGTEVTLCRRCAKAHDEAQAAAR